MNKIILSLFGIKMKGFECTIIMDINKGDKDSFQGQLEVIKIMKHAKLLIFKHFFLQFDPKLTIIFKQIKLIFIPN